MKQLVLVTIAILSVATAQAEWNPRDRASSDGSDSAAAAPEWPKDVYFSIQGSSTIAILSWSEHKLLGSIVNIEEVPGPFGDRRTVAFEYRDPAGTLVANAAEKRILTILIPHDGGWVFPALGQEYMVSDSDSKIFGFIGLGDALDAGQPDDYFVHFAAAAVSNEHDSRGNLDRPIIRTVPSTWKIGRLIPGIGRGVAFRDNTGALVAEIKQIDRWFHNDFSVSIRQSVDVRLLAFAFALAQDEEGDNYLSHYQLPQEARP